MWEIGIKILLSLIISTIIIRLYLGWLRNYGWSEVEI